MKVNTYRKIALSLSVLFLYGCGSSSSSNSNSNEPKLELIPQNEPYFKYAWHLDASSTEMNNIGYSIDPNADVHVVEAWNVTKGANIKVAVIDEGFDVSHEELKANTISTYNADENNPNVENDGNQGIHGNTCAGFILASVNRKGISGIAPESKLIAIKQVDENDAHLIRAFEYARNQGAKVISCSWGSGQISETIVSELKSLYDSGITVIFASGNEGIDLDQAGYDESEVPWVIGVGASGENNDVTSYSNYGKNTDVLAPAGDAQLSSGILGIDDTGSEGSQDQKNIVNNNYAFTDGTSFACPLVAGAVSLMYSVNPNISPAQIRDIIISTADKIGGANLYDNNGFDKSKRRAYGKINISAAVAQASR